MAGLEDSYYGLAGNQAFGFPSATRGLSSFGTQQLERYSKLIPEATGLNAALSELQLEKSRFEFLNQKRKIESALREERDKNRTVEQGLIGLQESQLLNPESDDYWIKRSELIKKIPYANYDPAFTRAIGVMDSRHSNFSAIKQQEDKVRHREAYTAYRSMIDSMSGPELFEYGDQIRGLSADSPMEDLIGAISTVKQAKATREIDANLRQFGYDPQDFSGDLTQKANAVAEAKNEYTALSGQQANLIKLIDSLRKNLADPELTQDKSMADDLNRNIKESVQALNGITAKMRKLTALKNPDQSLKGETPQAAAPVVGNAAAIAVAKQVMEAQPGTSFDVGGKPIFVNNANKEKAREMLMRLEPKQ